MLGEPAPIDPLLGAGLLWGRNGHLLAFCTMNVLSLPS